jgi:glycine cleavage system H protein
MPVIEFFRIRTCQSRAAPTLSFREMTPDAPVETLHYKRSHFVTQLPIHHRYSASHAWIAPHDDNTWRIGLTKFATRMLGEIVDVGFEPAPGTPVKHGDVIGWIEGFKAISDIFCIAEGNFAGANTGLKEDIELVSREPYGRGWLYLVTGTPDAQCVDVYAYRDILDQTIDRILAKQQGEQDQ